MHSQAFLRGVGLALLLRYENTSRSAIGKVPRANLSQVRRLFWCHSDQSSAPLLDPRGKRLVQALQLRDRLGAPDHGETTTADKNRLQA